MKKLLIKSLTYGFLMFLSLEILVRILYLGKDTPQRFIDKNNVEKWVPNQEGYAITGNRRQNFAKYRINSSGFNSYREFNPSGDKIEIALVGDSFIEGFHQNYYNSIGTKIEKQIPSVEVYEYGYSGYDFADQLHLIQAERKKFDLIDHVFITLKFTADLNRGHYKISSERLKLESGLYKVLRKSKLVVYLQNIGFLSPITSFPSSIKSITGKKRDSLRKDGASRIKEGISLRINNFKNLVALYGFDKKKNVILLDVGSTPPVFLDYLDSEGYSYLDFGKKLSGSGRPTTLVYDKHWNDHGRALISELVVDYLDEKDLSNYWVERNLYKGK